MIFTSIKPNEMPGNAIKMIGHDWMLVTAGTEQDFNTMTAAWGGLGFLWNKPIAIIFIRPQRYTYQFTEKYNDFSLSFFDKQYRDMLNFCGTRSGRDTDKVKETGLTPMVSDLGNICFEEARVVLECRKIYFDDIKPENFLDKGFDKHYPQKDYHRMYIGLIENCLIKI